MPSALEQISESVQLPTVEKLTEDPVKWTRDFLALLEEQYNLFVTSVKEMLLPAYVIARQGDLQASVDEAQLTGRPLYIPGSITVNGEVLIQLPIKIFGNGFTSEIVQTNTIANTFKITTTLPCVFEDFKIRHSGTATAGAGLYFDSGGAANVSSKVRGVRFDSLWRGIHFERGAYYQISSCDFILTVDAGIFQKNPNFGGDEGDMVIAECLFSLVTGAGVRWRSGGGLKILGCKFLSGVVGIECIVDTGVTTGILIVSGCSIENFTTTGIGVSRTGTGTLARLSITGNEFLGIGDTWTSCIVIDVGVEFIDVVGNVFDCRSAVAGGRAGVLSASDGFMLIGHNVFGAAITGGTINAIQILSNTVHHVSDNLIEGAFTNRVVPTGTGVIMRDMNGQTVAALTALPFANGTMAYCTDCTIANPCAGGGTGAIFKRLNGVNVCN